MINMLYQAYSNGGFKKQIKSSVHASTYDKFLSGAKNQWMWSLQPSITVFNQGSIVVISWFFVLKIRLSTDSFINALYTLLHFSQSLHTSSIFDCHLTRHHKRWTNATLILKSQLKYASVVTTTNYLRGW